MECRVCDISSGSSLFATVCVKESSKYDTNERFFSSLRLRWSKYQKHSCCRLHRLSIESGRWTKPTRTPLEERLCYLCNTLEDECHFVLECPAYNEFRCKYIHKYYWKRPSMSKFTELMTTDNKPILQKLACFVQKSFALRNELLYAQA